MSEELKITGTLIEIFQVDSGVGKSSGKEWKNRQFIIETDEKYPKKICCVLFGDKIDLIYKFSLGTTIEVKINIESRESNGKWFTNIQAWSISGESAVNIGTVQETYSEPIYSTGLSVKEQIMEKKANEPEPEEDDLPFN